MWVTNLHARVLALVSVFFLQEYLLVKMRLLVGIDKHLQYR